MQARYYAILAASLFGRGVAKLAELDALIAELECLSGADRQLLLGARVTRGWVLLSDKRPAEAEAEAEKVLRALTRIEHLVDVWHLELETLDLLGASLCAQERHEEAETVARGHLPRADGELATALHHVLIDSLSGQGRHEEALAETNKVLPTLLPHISGRLELARAVALHALGRHEEAKTEALRALTACERYLHPQHLRIGEIHALLARIASA